MTVARWLASTSNRTFVAIPLALIALEAVLARGLPRINPWGLPLCVWGYTQYRLAGRYRLREGGGGPGMSNPPERLVVDGPYRYVRNPMYLGHLIFLAGVALALQSLAGAAVLALNAAWFDRRARRDEARLAERFGDDYRAYTARVRRWLPRIG